MEYELYSKLTKGNGAALKKLQEQELPYAYFVCYQLTNDARTAATLVRRAWKETLEKIEGLGGYPAAKASRLQPIDALHSL